MPTFKTDEPKQGGARVILKPGEYGFTVVDATEKVAKSTGNPMIELKLRVNDEAVVYDNLVFTPKAFWKIDQFLKSVKAHPGPGHESNIEADDCLGLEGTCNIKTEKDQGGNDRNVVDAYTWEEDF